jgi:hypothetical protein
LTVTSYACRARRGSRKIGERAAKLHNRDLFDWDDLKYFLGVAGYGNITAAAKALKQSQSTVQRRLLDFRAARSSETC